MSRPASSLANRSAALIVGCFVLVASASALTAQERTIDGDPDRPIITPVTPVPFVPVEGVDLMAPRMDGPPALVILIEAGKLRPAPGTYRMRDGKALRISEHGQIVELIGGEVKTQPFRVASIDQVAVRQAKARPRIVLQDARRHTVALPDGRYVNQDQVVLVVRNGTIVGYGTAR